MKKQQFACMGLLCAILWAGCNGKKLNSTADSASSAKTEQELNAPKLVKTADMHFKVKDVEHASEDISTLAEQCDGMVMHHTVHSSTQKSEDIPLNNDSVRQVTSYNTTAEMVVKVPSELTEAFMNQVSKMAIYIDARNMDVQDRTLDYLSSKMKADNRMELVRDQKAGKTKITDSTYLLSVKDDIVDRKIGNLRTDADVKYSTIALSIYQSNTITKDMIVNDDPSAYRLPFFSRIGMAFQNGWLVLNEAIIALMNLWPLILVCFAGGIGYRYVKRKKAAAV